MHTLYTKGQPSRWMRLLGLLLLLLLPLAGRAQTPVSIASTPYTENFDGMGATGTSYVAGWTGIRFAGTGTANATLAPVVDNGASTTGAMFNVGTTGAGERALASLASGTTIPRFGATFKNTAGNAITQLALAGVMEQWKSGSSNVGAEILPFEYSLDATSLTTGTWTAVTGMDLVEKLTATTTSAAVDGNAAANRTAISATITGLNIANNATFWIRWTDTNDTGSDGMYAIDDFSMTPTVAAAATCMAPGTPSFSGTTTTSTSVAFTPDATNTGTYTVTATPASGPVVTATGAGSPISLTGLAASTTYSVKVTATCTAAAGGGPSPASAAASVTTLTPTATCVAPTGVAATPASTTASIAFTGDATATAGYIVNYVPTAGGTALTQTGAASPIALTGLAPGTQYSATVTSNCGGGTLATSSPAVTFTTLALAPTLAVSQGGTSYPSNGTAYSFGNQTVSTTSPAVAFTLTNSGPDALTISDVSTTGDYAVSGAAPTTVAANGGTATVSVTFTPTTTGTRSGTLVISSNATNGATYTVNLTGNGQAAALPDLTVSTGTTASPTPIMGNYNNVTITGTGNAILAGPLTVAGTLTIQPGGGLAQNCQLLSGSGSFNLQAGGTLAICDAAGISPTGVPTGAVLLTGTRTYSPLANYIYNGSAAQVTGLGLPGTILALGVQNAAGATLSQALSLTQGLNLNLGNLNTGGQAFTLLSTNTGTAGVVNTNGVVVGTATVQRFINSSNAIGYRHYSAPVSNTTFADLSAPGFSPVFNSGYNTSSTPGTATPFPTVFGYNQDRLTTTANNLSAFDKGWFSPTGSGDPMVVGKGYTVNVSNTALIDFMGTLNTGAVPSGTLSRGPDAAAGWHLLGNPYPSPIDWSTVTPGQRPGMDAAIYVFESAGQYGGSYRASVNGVGGNASSPQPIVVSSQGYFVRVTTPNGTGSVNLDNSNRVTTFGTQPSFGRGTADARPQVALTLQGASVSDAAYVYFQAGATAGKDVEYDATKLPNSHGLNLASLAGGEALAINGLPALGTATLLVPLNVAAPKAGSYSLLAGALDNLTGTTVTLLDALTGTRTVLTAGTAYAFSLSTAAAPGRFALEFRPSGALATTAAQALAAQTQLFPNPASGSFRVQLPVLATRTAVQATLLNALGQTVLHRSLSAAAGQALDAEFDVRALAAGVYTLRLDVAGTPVARKVVIE